MDILARLGEAFGYDDLELEVVEVDGVSVRVATPRTLYRMKKDTVRSQDRADAHWLAERYDLREVVLRRLGGTAGNSTYGRKSFRSTSVNGL